MKAKRGMIALVTELTRDYSRGGYAGEPAHRHYFGVVTKITREGMAKEISVIGGGKTYVFPSRYGREKLVGLVGPERVDIDAAIAAIAPIQNPGNAKTWHMWESETKAVEFLKRFKL